MDSKSKVLYIKPYYVFNCPHCNIYIEVNETDLNCKIFRCGIYKNNGLPMNPHETQSICEQLVNDNLIYGCSKPFIFKDIDNERYIEQCDYI